MGADFDEDHGGASPELWAEPFRKSLGLRGRPDSKLKWYLIWAGRFAAYLADRPLHLATNDNVKGFLTTLASSPRISDWQVEQATDALTIPPGSVFGQEWARTILIPALPPPPDLLGRSDVSTTMIYTHMLNRPASRCAALSTGRGKKPDGRRAIYITITVVGARGMRREENDGL